MPTTHVRFQVSVCEVAELLSFYVTYDGHGRNGVVLCDI
jgi:hypothetical protein